ncbi:MAG: hypothetical protein JO110_20520, partial [Acetobacteraceae bacterium]|nr:hypothetical protein [Acetobacteraceae bacterium]
MKPQHLGALALWFPLILGGIGAMHWGAERVSNLLGGLRRHWGLPETAAGTVLALATSSPELAVNTVSAIFRWPDIGLGTDLGANVPALPVILSISWVAARWFGRQRRQDQESPPPIGGETVPVQFSPYLLVVLLLAALTLPPAWRGLRPIDAAILAAAFAIYFAHAVLRGRDQSESKRNNDG